MSSRRRPTAILAVDGGNSKLDAVLIGADGTVLGAARGHGASFAPGDHEDSFDELTRTVHRAARAAGIDPERGTIARVGVHCLAGADLPVDDRRLQKRLKELAWTQRIVLRNDTFAVLRAGTDRTWGVGVVCGYGTNCAAVAPDGRVVRFPAVGSVSGDWGGGADVGATALWHAIRAEDGRGAQTSLRKLVPDH